MLSSVLKLSLLCLCYVQSPLHELQEKYTETGYSIRYELAGVQDRPTYPTPMTADDGGALFFSLSWGLEGHQIIADD